MEINQSVFWLLFVFTLQLLPTGRALTLDQIITEAIIENDVEETVMRDPGGAVQVELDMLFTRDRWIHMHQTGINQMHKRNGIRDESTLWTNNVVPYSLDGLFDGKELSQIESALTDWERYTCLTFRQANEDEDVNFIQFMRGTGCYSYLGMIGGAQELSLGKGCAQKGIVIHELGHALGLFHEQTRPDRDDHVEILTENVLSGLEDNFRLYSSALVDTYGVPYDYRSIMHYGQYFFSKNGEPTIRTLDPSQQDVIGNREALSFRDIKIVNLMYGCGASCGDKSCPGEGFLGEDCVCYCPGDPLEECQELAGTSGVHVQQVCEDDNSQCKPWAVRGECTANPDYMLANCRRSCSQCGNEECRDQHVFCHLWSEDGECEKNPSYMLQECRYSCQQCS